MALVFELSVPILHAREGVPLILNEEGSILPVEIPRYGYLLLDSANILLELQ